MIEPLYLDGISYNKEMIDSLCQPLLDVRDLLLSQAHFEHAVAFSHIHALLQHLKVNTKE